MLGISRRTDYAARIVLHLACLPEGNQVSIRQISEQRLLPAPFVRRLIAELVSAGILRTTRGSNGGVALKRPASEISLLDLVRATEGGIVINHCVDDPKACPLSAFCPVQNAWTGATRTLEGYLDSVRFNSLAQGTDGHLDAHRSSHALQS
jgi:Rrf2 family protein